MTIKPLLLILVTLLLLSVARVFAGQVIADGDSCVPVSVIPCVLTSAYDNVPTSTPTFITIIITDTPTRTPTVTPTPSSTATTVFETVVATPTTGAPVRKILFMPVVKR